MKNLIVLLLIICSLTCCKIAEDLTILKESYFGNDLKLNGYYYHKYETGYVTFFLYRDGVYYDTNALLDVGNLEMLDNRIYQKHVQDNAVQLHWYWGVYKITGKRIEINHWLPGTGGAYPTKVEVGNIINDSTICISGLRGKKYEELVDTFRFRHLHPKPDSTNVFIN